VPGIARDIVVKVASEPDEYRQAFRLLTNCYRSRGYDSAGVAPYRFSAHHALPETAILVAKHGKRVVATLSMIPDTTLLGLPMEATYPVEVARLRLQGRRLGEACNLAGAGLGLHEFARVFLALIKLAIHYHVSRGGDSWIIAVHPRHRKFYRRMLGFVPFGGRRAYSAVRDHPAEAYVLDAASMAEHAPKSHRKIFGEPLPAHVLAPVGWSPRLVRFFGRRSSQVDPETIEHILRAVDRCGAQRRW
jgi:hypothetical protein